VPKTPPILISTPYTTPVDPATARDALAAIHNYLADKPLSDAERSRFGHGIGEHVDGPDAKHEVVIAEQATHNQLLVVCSCGGHWGLNRTAIAELPEALWLGGVIATAFVHRTPWAPETTPPEGAE